MLIEKIEEMPAVWVYKNYFDVGNFIEKFEEETEKPWPYLDWRRSITGDGGDYGTQESEHRSSLEASLFPLTQDKVAESIEDLANSYRKIFSSIDQCIWDYRNSFDLFLRGADGMQLLKYENNAQYHAHHDHSSENQRILSLVACFGEEFDGGELEFPYFNKTIKLEKNSLVLFPSNFPYTHIAHPVTSGVKYSMVMWFV